MPVYLTLYEGQTPAEAQPVVATSDPHIIAMVRRLLMERLGDTCPTPVMQLTPSNSRNRPKRKVSPDGRE
jgi:hypothetical protein